jgi:lipid A 3-O-deacylase
VQLGGVMRFGQGLNSDFGVARIQPGLSGTDAFTPTQPFVWYVFGGMDGQVVGTDITLNGNTFPGGPHVAVKWDVGELEAGAAIIYHGVRVTYSQTWQTQEFRTQKAGLFNFGSLAVSVRF